MFRKVNCDIYSLPQFFTICHFTLTGLFCAVTAKAQPHTIAAIVIIFRNELFIIVRFLSVLIFL